ncbi:penicillin-binding transpeptidase domain-containing protein [Terrisporobacter sp.]|uniref:penicillin-binding transpeptidase domain-containing protein n=1 Tax=Terrisporobacter sp. TaxID=1965305 RepID=UPI002602E8A7|nr:penicillin-binding transpeptidase domain-containing protein [Terrisporobacter sp.]
MKLVKSREIITIISIMVLAVFILSGCSSKNKIEDTIDNYTKLLNDKKYDDLYEMLTTDSKNYIKSEFGGKEEFINKYNAIYSAMGVNNIKISVKKINDKLEVPITISMSTVAGELKYDNTTINLEKEDDGYKISWNESLILPDMVQGDKVRVKTTIGSRGKILDRDGNLLAYNGEVNFINVDTKKFKESSISKLAKDLDISEKYISDKIKNNSNPEYAVFIVKVPEYEKEKLEKISAIECVTIQKNISRVYAKGEAFGSLLGYIGSITAEELEKNPNKGYTTSSQIGKNGLEQVYEDKLRAKDGVHIYIERGDEDITVAETKVSNGKDIKLAIDSKLQQEIYNQMNKEKGASIAMDSSTGEVLAMVSSPSYDSNTLVTYKTKAIAKEWEESKNAHFDNRANNLYSPGSTMKLLTASIGLENNLINPNEKMNINGLQWQNSSSWGKYKVSRVKDVSSVGLYEAVIYSDNIYFADKAIKIGSDKLIEGAKKFGIGADIDFEYPMPKSQIANHNKIDKEILLADTGYGQGEILTTPLEVTMSYSALANEGKIMTPRLVLSENNKAKVFSEAINKEHLEELQKDFAGVINDPNGSGYLCKIDGVNLAGKTGTAEIKSTKDDETGNENSWFVAVDMDNSKLAVSMVMEDMKGKSTSKDLVPKVKNIMESYIKN